MIPAAQLKQDYILPSALGKNAAVTVAEAVAGEAVKKGIARTTKIQYD